MPTPPGQTITFGDFDRVDIRVGRIVRAEPFPEARKPAYKLTIDFGVELGTRRSSAQLTQRYSREELEGRLVIAVVNFPPRQIGPFMSQVLTLGVPDEEWRGGAALAGSGGPAGRPDVLTVCARLWSQATLNRALGNRSCVAARPRRSC